MGLMQVYGVEVKLVGDHEDVIEESKIRGAAIITGTNRQFPDTTRIRGIKAAADSPFKVRVDFQNKFNLNSNEGVLVIIASGHRLPRYCQHRKAWFIPAHRVHDEHVFEHSMTSLQDSGAQDLSPFTIPAPDPGVRSNDRRRRWDTDKIPNKGSIGVWIQRGRLDSRTITKARGNPFEITTPSFSTSGVLLIQDTINVQMDWFYSSEDPFAFEFRNSGEVEMPGSLAGTYGHAPIQNARSPELGEELPDIESMSVSLKEADYRQISAPALNTRMSARKRACYNVFQPLTMAGDHGDVMDDPDLNPASDMADHLLRQGTHEGFPIPSAPASKSPIGHRRSSSPTPALATTAKLQDHAFQTPEIERKPRVVDLTSSPHDLTNDLEYKRMQLCQLKAREQIVAMEMELYVLEKKRKATTGLNDY